MSSYRFIDTKRFSPVIYENDLPIKEDYFHLDSNSITKEFLKEGNFIVDKEWWIKQRERCINGYTVPNSFTEGGDCYITEQMKYEFANGEYCYYGGNIIEKGNKEVYFKDLDITIKDGLVHITGKHYFYLNFWKIKRLNDKKTRKDVLYPKFTDLSFDNWHIRERMKREFKDSLTCKSRQKGYSEEEACDTVYEYLFYNNAQNVIVAGEDKYNENTMRMVKRGLGYLRNGQFFKEFAQGGNSEDYIRTKNTGSEVYSITCLNNSEAVSSLTPSKLHLEEIGIWKKGLVKEVSETVDSSLEAEGVKTGYKIFIGTGGNIENGVADMEKMAYKPDKNNLLEFDNTFEENDGLGKICRFVPAYKFEIIDKDGNSLVKESLLKLEKERQVKSIEDRYINTVMKPVKLSEIFSSKQGGYFGAEVSMWCNERKAFINNHREAQVEKRYRGYWRNPKSPFEGVIFEPDPLGAFMISELPEKDNEGKIYANLYRQGTDSYDQDEAGYSTSLGSSWVKKGFLNANKTYNIYVAGILERPTTGEGGRELFYEHTAMLGIAYNTSNLIEWSNKLIFDWYRNNNMLSILKLRPEFITANLVKDSRNTNKYGIDPSTKPDWLVMQKSYLKVKENIEKCNHIVLLEAWSRFKYNPQKKYNCDITIATSLCTVCEQDEKEMKAYSESDVKKTKTLSYIRDSQGNLVSTFR
ncbi:MAG: hypothetical protein M0P71_14700 [Melioribacteraceae bacterium]|jgi:hypothetical protein|nr:hypothetical protein [Melioribacteraceae bacterium]